LGAVARLQARLRVRELATSFVHARDPDGAAGGLAALRNNDPPRNSPFKAVSERKARNIAELGAQGK